MKKHYIYFHYILGGLMSLMMSVFSVSCDDSELVRRVDPQIEVQEDLFVVPSASWQVVELHSTYPWFAEASDSWIKLQRYRGQSLKPDSIVAYIEENPGMAPREGWIEIRLMDQMSKRIAVKQNGRGSLITLSKKLIYFNVNGGETTLDVYTDLDWDTDIKQEDGFSFTKVDKNHLKIRVDRNTTGANREKTVILKDLNGTETAKLEVVQINVEKMLSIALTPETKDILLSKGESGIEIPVSLNVEYDCISSDENWINITETPSFSGDIVQDIVIKATIDSNNTGEERHGYIIVKDKSADSEVFDIFYISQMARSRRVYVKAGGTGDGTSWERAFGTIEEGMATCDNLGDMELWVAEGNYQLKSTLIWKTVNVYGGFEGSETKLKERNLNKKSTIVGGNFITISAWGNKNTQECYYLDGFVLTGANGPTNDYMGTFEIYKLQAFRNCVIHGNVYGKNGGGYFQETKLINCLFYNNTTTLYSSVINTNGTDLYNVTIVNNIGKGSGGGIRIGGSNSTVYNTVVWGNVHTAGNVHQVYLDANQNSKFVNCAVQGGFVFNGNNTPSSTPGCITLNADNAAIDGPRFVDPTTYNYQLQENSPLVNAGSNAAVEGIGLLEDIISGKRIWGDKVDIGAFEYFTKNSFK